MFVYGLTVTVHFMKRKFRLTAVYRTHDSNLDTFIIGLEVFYSYINKGKTNVIIGDINIDTLRNNARVAKYTTTCWTHTTGAGLVSGVSIPTSRYSEILRVYIGLFDRNNIRSSLKLEKSIMFFNSVDKWLKSFILE